MAKKRNTGEVEVVIKKHNVTIKMKKQVFIHHKASCPKPCSCTDDIIEYLKAEAFIGKNYKVSDLTEEN
jgi:hypothetical protein